jgi:hypothetical protein
METSDNPIAGRRLHPSWLVVAVVVGWELWILRATLLPVSYLDDASVHEQMVRYATDAFRAGHNPLTGWFPYLGAGSPQFLHYQSLGAMITGLAGVVVGADTAFRWSLYLLLALWPIVIYASARVFGLGPWAAAIAAAVSPLLMSVPGVGYEQQAYVWVGFGVWAQLWASWALPFAWAFTWRSMDDSRMLGPAALAVAITTGLHFETGYLAFLPIILFPFVTPSDLRARALRAVVLLGVSLVATAWVLVPVIEFGKWAAVNQVLHETPLVNGYGAKRILSWLISGQVYDSGRFPVVTVLVLLGIATAVVRWRTYPLGRALAVMWILSLLLAFGRTTFGPLVDVVPGSGDIFFRRFLMGAQLAGLYLAGIAGVTCWRLVLQAAERIARRWTSSNPDRDMARWTLIGLAILLGVAAAVPAIIQIQRFDSRNATSINYQRTGEAVQGPEVDALIDYIATHEGGRTYAGLPTNWGSSFTVGMVPVFKYLESRDVDEIGYTLRTASLMTDPEYYFDESNPSDYTLFGVRYLILPAGKSSPVPALPVMQRGPYRLWAIGANGYLDVVEKAGVVHEDRANIATQSLRIIRSSLIARQLNLVVDFDGPPNAARPTVPRSSTAIFTSPGSVTSQPLSLRNGIARGTVHLVRPAIVMLSASFDPGWQVTVDGHPQPIEMLAPAVVGVKVSAGIHRVEFTYRGFSLYPELMVSGFIAVLVLLALTRGRRRIHICRGPTTSKVATPTPHGGSTRRKPPDSGQKPSPMATFTKAE